MSSVRLADLSFRHHPAEPLLDGLTAHAPTGWTAIVGSNGAGKTTLLHLLAGQLTPDGGTVLTEPREAILRHCPQEVSHCSAEVSAFANAMEGEAIRLRGWLHLEPEELSRWETLSPGERKRWQVGAALAADPDVLLLDEPTNHLDTAARTWLLDVLARFRGVGILVSHDRDLMDRLVTQVWRLEHGRLESYRGGWSDARTQWEAEAIVRHQAREAAKGDRDRAAARLDRTRRDREAAEGQRNAGRRMKDKHDSDARGLGADFAAARAERALGRGVTTQRRALEAADARLGAHETRREVGRSLFVAWDPPPKATLGTLPGATLSLGPTRVLDVSEVTLARDTRVRLEGPNGAGKTTLLRALVAGLSIPEERLLWLPQDLPPEHGAALLAETRALPVEVRGRVLQLVAALGVDPDRLLATDRPSPGEARKLALALGLGRHAWLVLLDEPTNHLDLPAIERLEEALVAYPGALVIVSHDPRFALEAVRERWVIREGRVCGERSQGER
jgi:ATPase subunit of ABC transporter with duplicated ATPase domains